MQDVIARGLNLKPQYVDPWYTDNKYIQVIPRNHSKAVAAGDDANTNGGNEDSTAYK